MTTSQAAGHLLCPSAAPSVGLRTLRAALKARLCAKLLPVFVLVLHPGLYAQRSDAATPSAGGNWDRVKALPISTKLHIATDHGGKTCRVFAVAEDTLTCAQGNNAAGISLQRAEIRHIRLAHYGRSTLVGAAVGGGVGATAGAIAGRTKPCPAGQGLCLNGIGIGAGGVAAIFGVAGGLLGSVVGGLSDMTRGSSIYIRP